MVNFDDEPYSFIWYMTETQGRRPTVMPEAEYRIIGLPISVSGLNGVADVIADDLGTPDETQWRLGRYEASEGDVLEYPPSTLRDVEPGIGYWLAARHGRRYAAEGYTVTPNFATMSGDYYALTLDSGWNQLANPFAFPINWEGVLFEDDGTLQTGHPSDVLDDAAWWYEGSQFVSVDSIPAWDGFFVYIKKNDIRILFPYWEYGTITFAPQKTPTANPGDWQLVLELSSKNYKDACNYIGVRSDARIGGDQYDFAEPPSPPGAPYLALTVPERSGLYSSDYRPQFNDGTEWRIKLSEGENRGLKINNLEQLPAEMEVWLVFDNNTRRQVTDENSLEINDFVKEARLIVGSRNYINNEMDELIPRDFALEQNYPNPFNPVTNICFDLPEAGRVRLEVFNILGQNVRTLVDREMTAGTYLVEWDSHDNSGNAVASGIYFYRISYGDIVATKKMVLLK
ncbi:MAG: T9SS type A sorting domain-containing protein [Candidatus Zixiibacteriota bacterium]